MFKRKVISGPYFPAFGLNTEMYCVSLRIQSECGKIRTRNNSVFGSFSRSVKVYFQLLKTWLLNVSSKNENFFQIYQTNTQINWMVYKHCVRHKFSNTEFALFCIFQKKLHIRTFFKQYIRLPSVPLLLYPQKYQKTIGFLIFVFGEGWGEGV